MDNKEEVINEQETENATEAEHDAEVIPAESAAGEAAEAECSGGQLTEPDNTADEMSEESEAVPTEDGENGGEEGEALAEAEIPWNKPKRKKIGKAAFFVTFALVMSVILCIWVISQVLSNGYISVGGYSLFRVASGSMEPDIPVGALLISKKTDIGNIAKGDVINFRSRDTGMVGKIITHRVIGVYEGADGAVYLETKGDANQYSDAKFADSENLIGRVVYATGEGNFFAGLIGFLTSKVGFWAFIVLPCILVGVGIMRDTIGTLRTEMDAIHKELDEMAKTVSQKDSELEKKEETYEEMYERLRRELLEELNQSAEQVETEEDNVAEK